MKLLRSKHWLAIGLGSLSGPVLAAAITCTVTPPHSIITEGQTLQLQAVCNGALSDVNWSMDGTSVTGKVTLSSHAAGDPIYYTTPVGLGDSVNPFVFTLAGTPVNGMDTFAGASAEVLVKPSSAVLAKAAGNATPLTQVDAACGPANGTAVTAMPTNGQQCDLAKGTPALAISGPTAFTWSCVSLSGGAEANCSATRGYTVTATDNGSTYGSVSPASQGVASGGTATVTAAPASGYSASMSGCGGTQSGNTFTTGPVTANCTVTASFTNSPQAAACGSANGVATLTAPTTGLCATGAVLGSVVSGTGQFTWTCDGPNSGADASCAAPKQYTVNATLSGTGGSINAPNSKTVTHNGSTTFTVTPEGTNVASASGCGASVSGNTVSTGAITGACTVTVSFGPAAPAGGISCNGVTQPGVVTEVVTGLSATSLARKTYAPDSGEDVYAFQITVPQTTEKSVRSMSATKTTSSLAAKRVVISACRGDYNPTGKDAGCSNLGTEVTTVKYAINYDASLAPTTRYCHLTPGNTYWVNVSSRSDPTQKPSCTSASNCGFYFESN